MPWNRFFQSTCHVLCRPSETDLHRLKCNTKIPMLQNLWQQLSCDWVLSGPYSDKGWRKVNYYYAFPIEKITFLSLACNTLDIRRVFLNPYSGIHFTQKKCWHLYNINNSEIIQQAVMCLSCMCLNEEIIQQTHQILIHNCFCFIYFLKSIWTIPIKKKDFQINRIKSLLRTASSVKQFQWKYKTKAKWLKAISTRSHSGFGFQTL